MHGCSLGSNLLVNAEVDSMGGIIDGGVGIGTKTSPRRAAIEKAQSELRLEYDVREERRRELEFLEKGGNPLDFKFGLTAPASVQSSSLADQLHGQFGTCEAKGGFALAASPRGDSIGSSGRLGATLACEPNSADNFDGENELIESEGKPTYASRSNFTPPEHSSQLNGSQNVRESEDSPIFHPKKAYRRRNRSKTNRDSARLSSTGIVSRGCQNSSFSDRHGVVSEAFAHESPSYNEMDSLNAATAYQTYGGLSEGKLDVTGSKHTHGELHDQNIKDDGVSTAMDSVEPNPSIGKEQTIAAVGEFPTCSVAEEPQNDGDPERLREPDQSKGDGKSSRTEGGVSSMAVTLKGDSESSCTQTSTSVDGNGNIDSGLCTSLKNVDSMGEKMERKVPLELTTNSKDEKVLNNRNVVDVAESNACINDSHSSQSCQANGFPDKDEEQTDKNQPCAQYEPKCMPRADEMQPNQPTDSILVIKQGLLDDSVHKVENCCLEEPQQPHNPSLDEITMTDITCSDPVPEHQPCDGNQTKVVDKAHEDRILEEARNIKAKLKIIEELSLASPPKEYRCKSNWDFVLEEMAWMANDFAQERVWKRTAAAKLCYRAAFTLRLRAEEQNKHGRGRVVARTLAENVMDFWHSAKLLVGEKDNSSGSEACGHGTATPENKDDNSNSTVGNGGHEKEYVAKNTKLAVQEYAVRFLQHNSSAVPIVKDTTSGTPESVSIIIGTPEITYQDQHAEEDLFYVVPHGAMEAYRKSIERYLLQCEKDGKYVQEEVNTSMYDAVAEFESQENEYEEDEGENVYYLPRAFEGSKASKFAQKKRKNPKLYSPMSYEVGGDFSYGHCIENRKRPANGLNVCPIPTKRVRTASRQRVVGPFSSGAAAFRSAPSRTDASSGDTNSFQDDQSTLHGGSLFPKGLEVESGMDYDKQSVFDSTEITAKPKKKKKTKHPGTAYGQRWQVDCSMQNEQRDHFKKRLESHQFNCNDNSGPFVPHAKKLKLMKQSLDNSFENTTMMSGSVASPVGSQMSNMSNPNKLIKLIGGRDRGKKPKSLKMPSGQTGSGSPWSLFEDQALVVLVHDMGPNWELVSDAINSTLHFKCIYRKPKECKERHAILLEKSCGDGADTEDSGSSQRYPSTLPGIPKGGARQLFQQLRGPMEEDTIRSHFEKIILIGQQLHGRKKQDPKQLVHVHSSHHAALSQVIPNDVNRGVLMPLDLCDMASSSPDLFSLSYQGSHTSGLPLPNQGALQSMLPSSSNASLQGSPGTGMGSNVASPSAQLNGPVRDGRYGVPRANLPIDEQQRIQQYNPMLSSRNIQQPNASVPGTFSGNDRGGRILPGGNGMVMPGMSRSMSVPRPGLQGISPSSMLNSGSVAASNMAGMPSSLNVHSGGSTGQGNSMLRPRDALHIVRPGQNPESHRQMMSSEMQMQMSNTNSQGVPTLGFPSHSASSPIPTYPVHPLQHQMSQQQSNVLSHSHHAHLQGSAHPGSTEQQAFALRLARDRQQRLLQRQQQQQQQQFPTCSAVMSHVTTQSQLPISTALQNSSQIQSHVASQPLSLPLLTSSSPMTPVTSQQQQKHQLPHHGRTAQGGTGGMIYQGGKQRQRQAQQLQQSGRQHPTQRQPSQSQQQAKLLKGMGRSNMSLHQNHPIDSSHLNGLSGNPGCIEKGEQAMHLINGQGYPTQSSKPAVPSPSTQSHPQQKLYSNSAPASSKQVQQMHSHPDSSKQIQAPAVSSPSTVLTSNQAIPPPVMPSPNHQQLKVHPHPAVKLVNHSQPTIHKAVPQNRVTTSEPVAKQQNDQSQAERQLANNTYPMSRTSGVSPICVESANAVPVACSSSSAQRTPEPLCDPMIPNSQLGPVGSPSMSNPLENQPVAPVGQGLGPKQLSNGMASHGSIGTQRKQLQQLQTNSSNQVLLQPKPQSQQQQLLEETSQRQPPLHQHPHTQVQTAQSHTFTRSSDMPSG